MKHYTKTIPDSHCGVVTTRPTYSEALDWLWDKGVGVSIRDESFVDEFGHHEDWSSHVYFFNGRMLGRGGRSFFGKDSFHEAVDAAITKALELINQN